MGDVIGKGSCCTGRDDLDLKRRAKEKLSPEANPLDDDVTRFDRAYDTNDTATFVELLHSNQPIDQLEERMHPWAADPQTVGALCATQLAILASRENNTAIKDTIREAGGIPALVRLLDSREDDRIHAAAIALSFLAVNNAANCEAMGQHGALRMLIKGMKSPIDGMRAASAQTCRNIYVLDMRYRAEFEQLGGVRALVALLEIVPHTEDDLSPMYTRIEAIYHIEDFIIENGHRNAAMERAVRNAGVMRSLTHIIENDDEAVSKTAQKLMALLEGNGGVLNK